MPGSKAPGLTEAEQEQREEAAKKHGVYAFRDRGSKALKKPQRSRLAELDELVQSRPGVIQLLQERASHAVLMAEMALFYVSEEAQAGVPIVEIPIAKNLPAFFNSAGRALKDLLSELPEDKQDLDITDLLRGDNGG
jgi:hypothetical protein